MNELVCRNGVGGSAGETDRINAQGEVLVCEVADLDNITILAIQATDAGTCTLTVEKSFDGVQFVPVGATIAESGFAAGANTAVERTLSDSNGMPLVAKQVRLSGTALAGGGVYKLQVCGKKRPGI